jgi:hypothetical protein
VDVLSAFGKNGEPVVTVQNGSVRAGFEATALARQERGLQFAGGEAAKGLELSLIEGALGVEECEPGRAR